MSYLSEHLPIEVETNISLHTQSKRAPISGTVMLENSYFPYCITNWRDLDDSVKSIPSPTLFKSYLRILFDQKTTACLEYKIKMAQIC